MICVSLGNIGFNRCLELLLKVECAEIRLDLLDLTDEEVKLIFSEPCALVATCRPGRFTEEERIRLMLLAIHHGAKYVDVEYEADAKFLHIIKEHAKDRGVKLIISYHDFEATPAYESLEKIIEQSRLMGADIVKIATMAHSAADCASVLSLYRKNTDLIAFCMGKPGVITRVAAPLLGAEFTFAAFDESFATAPGQLTVEKMEKLYETLNPEHRMKSVE